MSSTVIELAHFDPWEFDLRAHAGENWWSRMSPRVLDIADIAREILGSRIDVSTHPRALGRYLGASYSDHNVDRWGDVRAIDVFPDIPQTPEGARRFYTILRRAGAGGVGVYPHWVDQHGSTRVGFHIGYRPGRENNPAIWGMVRDAPRGPHRTVSIGDALAAAGGGRSA